MIELNHELYLLKFVTKEDIPIQPSSESSADLGDSSSTTSQEKQDDASASDDDLLCEDMDTDNDQATRGDSNAPRHCTALGGSKTSNVCVILAREHHLEKSVFSKIQGAPISKSYLEIVKKKPTNNIGKHLLQKFDEVVVKCAKTHTKSKTAARKQDKWGPVVATRMSSRINMDGKPALQKAQDLLQVKYLDILSH